MASTAPREFDVVIAADFRDPRAHGAAAEVEAQARSGLTTALVQLNAPGVAPAVWPVRLRDVVAAGLADILSSRAATRARLLTILAPPGVDRNHSSLAVRADDTVVDPGDWAIHRDRVAALTAARPHTAAPP